MIRFVFGFILVAIAAVVGFRFTVGKVFVNPYRQICDLVAERVYLENREMGNWTERCLARASLVKPFTSKDLIATDARRLLEDLRVSHLELYDGGEVRRIWDGVDEQTGIESEFVDGELAVFAVHPGSPAADRGLHRGDVIVSVQGAHPAPEIARRIGGDYVIRRGGTTFTVQFEPRAIVLDESPKIVRKDDWVLVRIPSFRAEFFDREAWQETAQKMRAARKVIVDLRGNTGGNFVAGLRFLSPFMCGEQEIGYLLKPKQAKDKNEALADDLRDAVQLATIERANLVSLKTYVDYGCLPVRVAVLVDSRTASTAEMVAQALRDYLDARVLGSTTAGQLLVGVWYDLSSLGTGWRLSIPEAVFQTRRGHRVEGQGVRVDRVLYDDLAEMQAGRDGWVERAVADLAKEPQAKGRERVDPDSKPSVPR